MQKTVAESMSTMVSKKPFDPLRKPLANNSKNKKK